MWLIVVGSRADSLELRKESRFEVVLDLYVPVSDVDGGDGPELDTARMETSYGKTNRALVLFVLDALQPNSS